MKLHRLQNFNCSIGDEINIFFLGDIHEGNINHDSKSLKKAVDIIYNTPNSHVIGMGDYTDAKLPSNRKHFDASTVDPSYSIADLSNLPKKQAQRFCKNVEKIKDKFICLLGGNHEFNVSKYNAYDVYEEIYNKFPNAAALGYMGILKIGFIHDKGRERANYTKTIMLNHGDGGGGFREGYPLNKVHDVFRWSDCDINIMGHIHQLLADDKKHHTVTQSDKLLMKRRFYGASGCFLRTYVDGQNNYFEHKGRFDSDIGMLNLKFVIKQNEPDIFLQTIKLA